MSSALAGPGAVRSCGVASRLEPDRLGRSGQYAHAGTHLRSVPNHFLINRYGETFDEVTASSLIKVEMDGNVLGTDGKFNDAGFIIRDGVYQAPAEANCMMHAHARSGAGISLLHNG
jgi:ribulose-5-phosphate 4-epimerase/fuculose-1-phosphate aldolase